MGPQLLTACLFPFCTVSWIPSSVLLKSVCLSVYRHHHPLSITCLSALHTGDLDTLSPPTCHFCHAPTPATSRELLLSPLPRARQEPHEQVSPSLLTSSRSVFLYSRAGHCTCRSDSVSPWRLMSVAPQHLQDGQPVPEVVSRVLHTTVLQPL